MVFVDVVSQTFSVRTIFLAKVTNYSGILNVLRKFHNFMS